MPMQPRFSSMALLIYSIGDLCVFIYNLPYRDFFEHSKTTMQKGYQVVAYILSTIFQFLYRLNYKGFFYQSYYTVLTIGYIICGNYTQVGQILNRYEAQEAEEKKIYSGDFISMFQHLKKTDGSISRDIADSIIREIIEEVASMCESESSLNMSCTTTSGYAGWEEEIENLEKEGIRKGEIEKEDESGYFEEEILE
eukprot:GFUD01028893.1.p1 GENE.GFUD01028893.1~~GFUD01028893.1.p1  ORF type:complete len:196 (-),score=41.80 GFUD01028893.1:79-666(-)